MRRVKLVSVVVVALVFAACGGSGEEVATPAPEPAAEDDNPTPEQDVADIVEDVTDLDEVEVADVFETEGGTATVSIGDDTWQFELSDDYPIANCDADFFGGFVAILTNSGADLSGAPVDQLTVQLPGGDFTDPPKVEVKLSIDSELRWIADETWYERSDDLPDGLGVTDFSIDGNTASGTAVFFEEESFHQLFSGTPLMTAEGTFEVSCASE